MRILVVYNTCGISGRDMTDWYLKCLETILNQKEIEFELVVSGCRLLPRTKHVLMNMNQGKISYNFIEDILPVNVTFNHTVRKCVEYFGNFNGYFYVDSGMKFISCKKDRVADEMIVAELGKLLTDEVGIVSAQADHDNGFEFGLHVNEINDNFIVPVGKACNAHTNIYSHKLYEAFNGKIVSDIFASTCSESVLSFLCAAANTHWVIHGDVVLPHNDHVDGRNAGFGGYGRPNPHWEHTYGGYKTMTQIIHDPEAWASGFGYEECARVFMHNPGCYDGNRCLDPERLRKFILNNLYLPLDYDTIVSDFYPSH
jgi:hypothetical protein